MKPLPPTEAPEPAPSPFEPSASPSLPQKKVNQICSLSSCSSPATAGVCGKCNQAWYCSQPHQLEAWKKDGHKKHCRLVGQSILGSSAASIVFVGQGSGKELTQHSTLGVRAVRRAYLAASIRPGFVKASRIEFGDVNLSDVVDIDLIKKEYPSEKIVIGCNKFLLTLSYCIGSNPFFLISAAEGAKGFTKADVVSASMRCYQWVYELENAACGSPRIGGIMLNRGYTPGPFQISMHDLEDLTLHGVEVEGGWPEEKLVGTDAPVTVLVHLRSMSS